MVLVKSLALIPEGPIRKILRTRQIRRSPPGTEIPLMFTSTVDRIQSAINKEIDVIDDYAELENQLRSEGNNADADVVNEIRNDEIDHRAKFDVMLSKRVRQ